MNNQEQTKRSQDTLKMYQIWVKRHQEAIEWYQKEIKRCVGTDQDRVGDKRP